jgi:hypothetical protein
MNEIGPAGITAKINYYASIEEQLELDLLEARKEREFWQLELARINNTKIATGFGAKPTPSRQWDWLK